MICFDEKSSALLPLVIEVNGKRFVYPVGCLVLAKLVHPDDDPFRPPKEFDAEVSPFNESLFPSNTIQEAL